MGRLLSQLKNMPAWELSGIILLTAAIIGAAAYFFIFRKNARKFIKYLEEALENDSYSNEIYSQSFLKRHSGIVENMADKLEDNKIIRLTGLDKMWLKQIKTYPSEKNEKRILKYIPEQGLFSCFLIALKKEALTKAFSEYINSDQGNISKLPLTGSGESFDGKAAYNLFSDKMDEIREMAGNPEWPVRYFAVKLLVHEESERAARGIIEAFSDPHPLVRKTVIQECSLTDREKIYSLLNKKLTDDPNFEVREAAYKRICKDFSDLHTIDYSKLSSVQALHALEFLDSKIENDIDASIKFLDGKDLELRFPSAMFLQETGILSKMLNEVSFEDTENLKRTGKLLKNAAEVKVTGFLKKSSDKPAVLYTALSILEKTGDRNYIPEYASRAFSITDDNEDKIWETAVKCIKERGGEAGASVLLAELKKVKYEDKKASFILNNLPPNIEHLSFKVLEELLKDSSFNSRNALIDAVSLLPEDIVIPELFKILKGGREDYPHNVRITTLKILTRFKLSYCVQPIIEQLPILPVSEAKEFSALLSDFAGQTFSSRIGELLNQCDAKVRAAVISTLPDSGKKEFIKQIRSGFDDADPDVRIACIWALADYEDNKLINQGFDMLRDPLERVRNSAAEVLGQFGSADKINNFSTLLKDENEVDDVKKSAVRGLCKSENSRAIDILVELVDENESLEEYTVKALAENPSKKTLTRIIENMKDGSPVLREKIINVFKEMGKSGEMALVKLLKDDIASLKESITVILEETGYVEHIIRKLSHRDPKIRRSAAEFLSMIGTKSAFRGIVLAARDPDQEVRVQVTRALEKLNSESGKKILEALKEDPDKRVRKFTMWALSRVKSKAIED